MKTFKYIFSVSFALLAASAVFAQQKRDPVEIYGSGKDIVDVKQFDDPVSKDSTRKWLRADIILDGKENPDKTATDEREKNWIKDVSLDVVLVYAKPNAKGEARWKPENWIVLKAKADIIAVKKGKKSIVTFFMPPEIKDSYRLQDSQRMFFLLELSVMGQKIELTTKNLKKFMSSALAKRIKNMKQFEKLKQDLAAASSQNDGWLILLPNTPFHIQYEEYYGKNHNNAYEIPTYKTAPR